MRRFYRRLGFRDGVDLVGEFSLISATGNVNLWVQVPGLRYFSIKIVLGLRRHTLWSFWVSLCEEGYAPVSPFTLPGLPKSVALSGTIIISYYIIMLCYLFNIIDFFLLHDCVIHCVILDGVTWWLSFGSSELGQVLPLVCVSHLSPATYWIYNPCRLGTEMVTSVRVSGWSIFCYRCLTLIV